MTKNTTWSVLLLCGACDSQTTTSERAATSTYEGASQTDADAAAQDTASHERSTSETVNAGSTSAVESTGRTPGATLAPTLDASTSDESSTAEAESDTGDLDASSELTNEAADAGTSVGDSGLSDPPAAFGNPVQAVLQALPSVRQEHGVVALGEELYVLGGFTPDVTTSVQAYAPATDTWRDVADFPVLFHHPNVAAVDGRIYVTGFLLGASLREGDGRVFSYEPAQDEWHEHTPMSPGTERGSACVAALGQKIYVFGGAGSTTMPDVSAYDTQLDSWEELPFMPELREHCVAAAMGDTIYIVSGRANGIGGVLTESYAFDPETKTYVERAPIPTGRGGTAGAVLAGRLFVFGGEGNDQDESGVFSQVEAFDPVTNAWQELPAMLMPRHGLGAASLGERIYLPGGGNVRGFGSVDDFTVFYFQP